MLNFGNFQDRINYQFKNPQLLQTALTHRSYLNEKDRNKDITEHNERLEFLGDAVLELIVTDHLYNNYSNDEGTLTSLRAALVNYKTLGAIGNHIGLDEIILISNGERAELGRARLSIVADATEALLGAIYLDGGYEAACSFTEAQILPKLKLIVSSESYKDSKTKLQEFTQKEFHQTPRYHILSTEGKDHEKVFFVAVQIGAKILAEGSGRSKQDAETVAASKAIESLLQIRVE